MKQPVCPGLWINRKNYCDCLYCYLHKRAWSRWINAQENVCRLTVQGAPGDRIHRAQMERNLASHLLYLAGKGIFEDRYGDHYSE